MFDVILDGIKSIVKSRLFVLVVIYLFGFGILISRIFNLQIVNGEKYEKDSAFKSTKNIEMKGTRGNIYDRNGKLLAYNELSYAVSIEDSDKLKKAEDKNKMINQLIKLIEQNGSSIVNNFNIEMDDNGKLSFKVKGNALTRFKKDVYSSEDLTKDQMKATAEDVFNYLRYGKDGSSNFNISKEYSTEEALKIMAVRYAIFMNRYQQYMAVTIATDVNEKTVSAIKENNEEMPGVDIIEESTRKYVDSKYFAHILGYTGFASESDLDTLGKSYNSTDQVGKSGVEKEYESYLRGNKGYQKVTVDDTGKILNVDSTKKSTIGNDVYLTIDKDLTIASYKLLEKKICDILVSKIVNSTSTGSKGKSADNITIPIYDVYYALLNNNIIDINHFTQKDATSLEKSVYQKFVSKQKSSIAELKTLLAINSKTKNSDVSDDMGDLLDFVYQTLSSEGILLKKNIDENDDVYKKYIAGKTSLSEFIQHAISSNWIDLSVLNLGDKYYNSDEIYNKLINYVLNLLQDNSKFNKKIYHILVYSYKLSGTEICLLLYDQGVLKYDKKEVDMLKKNGSYYAYNFIIKKLKKLEITPAQLALEPCSGSVVITDVNTGTVLALVSYPSYDNNRMANTVDAKYYAKLSTDLSSPFLNRPTQASNAPGSTFKMISTVTGLEEGVITPTEKIKDLGEFTKIKPYKHCWAWPNHTHGSIDVSDAIRDSCNYFFYEVGYRLSQSSTNKYISDLGIKKFQKYAKMFGLDKKSGIEIQESKPHVSDTDAVATAIGQGTNNFAPIQISRYLTTVANSGTCYNLTLLDKIIDYNGKTIVTNKAKVHNNVEIKQSTWDSVHSGMYKVVNAPTNNNRQYFKDLKVEVAGKTGTAQLAKTHPNHALFVSYAPFDKPEISMTVVIPNGYTSANAVQLASKIYKYKFNKTSLKDLLSDSSKTSGPSGVTD
ncbi:penicillin-binding transpeptidase domain-containing protein [Anaeromicropila herbilytica]|uniref:Penicillin-binding protein 2 n=1 Tax=Anaeromicropila herbilytica TaxID=2785025 RepID=A0A7R7IEK8_9FIRM|nr:penicillin-binding transpeptidase domain-containing protein [Anaeromicropila herbilytica]BCN31208.1 hypothetical protein bsdtb5_25030 [Anaeromicropila herbilytica]